MGPVYCKTEQVELWNFEKNSVVSNLLEVFLSDVSISFLSLLPEGTKIELKLKGNTFLSSKSQPFYGPIGIYFTILPAENIYFMNNLLWCSLQSQ